MLGQQADLLVQFTKHGILRRFTALDATLRKLPTVCAYALAPKNLMLVIDQNNADVGAKALAV